MENVSCQEDNSILHTKIEATLGKTNKDMLVYHIPTQLGFAN